MSQCMTLQYRAQGPDGSPFNGTLEATDVQAAREQLVSLGLTVLEMKPTEKSLFNWPRRAISGTDLHLFNEQLINLTKSGMPVEQGLKLIAQDLQSSRLKTAVEHVVSELNQGQSLADAFESQRQHFPVMYARLIEVGTQTGRLPGVLFNLGQHLKLVGQLKTSLARAFAYPIIVLLFFIAIMGFMSFYVGPQFEHIYEDFDTDLPGLTVMMLAFFNMGYIIIPTLLIAIGSFVLVTLTMRFTPWWQDLLDRVMRFVPFVGPVLRRNAIARWCDSVRMGINASMDLPHAMALSSDLIGLPSVKTDTRKVIDCVEQGRPFASIETLTVLPPTVLATIELAENAAALESSLEDLSSMYRQQAYLRTMSMETVLTPILMIGMGLLIGFSVLGLFLPLVKLLTNLT
ncbi:MAG: hypothetical protein CMJ19_22915 [Phycisphaeraceae bacterium]|nr:hypothetical protein [Phycisphaeraceae bacterium]